MQKNIIKVFGDGWLSEEPELKFVNELQKNVCTFKLAVNHTKRFKEEKRDDSKTSFFEMEVWDELAVASKKFLSTGSKITFIGELKQDKWVTSKGEQRSKIKIIAQEIRFDHISQKEEQ